MLTGDAAEQGAGKLAEFYEGINASRAVDPHMTALGHSYGSLTQGIALTNAGSGVDDAVFFGSPGIAAGPVSGADGVGALELDDGAAYNLEAQGDRVADFPDAVPRYGGDLADMAGMHQLSTAKAVGADGMPLVASHGHSEYTMITPDGRVSTSMYNVANVVAGMSERTVPVGAN